MTWFPDGATTVHVSLTTISHKSVASSPVQNTPRLQRSYLRQNEIVSQISPSLTLPFNHSPEGNILRKVILDQRVNKMPQSAEQDGTTDPFELDVDEGEPTLKTNAVQMAVPTDPTGEPVLKMHLGEPGASDIIQKMTGVELHVVDKVRHVCLQNGIRVVPKPSMRINGFTEKGIDEIFPPLPSPLIATALRSGTLYKKEKAGESFSRSSVSFIVPELHDADIIMELTLGRELGDKIQKTLFT